MAKTLAMGVGMMGILYTITSIAAIYLFGQDLIIGKADLMRNIDLMYKVEKTSQIMWISNILKTIFLLLLFFHIPFIFFFGKDFLMLGIDEALRKTTSQ